LHFTHFGHARLVIRTVPSCHRRGCHAEKSRERIIERQLLFVRIEYPSVQVRSLVLKGILANDLENLITSVRSNAIFCLSRFACRTTAVTLGRLAALAKLRSCESPSAHPRFSPSFQRNLQDAWSSPHSSCARKPILLVRSVERAKC
jgi:hypothetical protein